MPRAGVPVLEVAAVVHLVTLEAGALAVGGAVVGGEDDQGVVVDALCLELVDEGAEHRVGVRGDPLHVDLVHETVGIPEVVLQVVDLAAAPHVADLVHGAERDPEAGPVLPVHHRQGSVGHPPVTALVTFVRSAHVPAVLGVEPGRELLLGPVGVGCVARAHKVPGVGLDVVRHLAGRAAIGAGPRDA